MEKVIINKMKNQPKIKKEGGNKVLKRVKKNPLCFY
jgi:hypothetical protein